MAREQSPEIPPNICSVCFRDKSKHAADCEYAIKLKEHGISSENENNESFDQQMADIESKLKKILNVPPTKERHYEHLPENFTQVEEIRTYCREKIEVFLHFMPMITRHVELTEQIQVISQKFEDVESLFLNILDDPNSGIDDFHILSSKAYDLKLMVDFFDGNLKGIRKNN